MPKHRLILVTPNFGRSISDERWETVDAAHVDAWTQLQQMKWNRTYAEGITVEIALENMISHGNASVSATRAVYENLGSPRMDELLNAYPAGPIRSTVTVNLDDSRVHAARNFAESAICDLFLLLNLASPGCFDLLRSELKISEREENPTDLSFSNYLFEAALLDGDDGKWPRPAFMPVLDTCQWYLSVRAGYSQLPATNLEKALFAILHMCKLSSSPELVVWIFYALETILDTKPGENLRSMADRSALLLDATADQSAEIRRNLRKMYDIRSSFVHGGLEVIHPLVNEILDRRIDERYDRIMDACNYGFRLLLCLIQKIAQKNARQVRFREMLIEP